MAFFHLVLFASKFNKVFKKLKTEKEAALAIKRGEKPKYGLRAKIDHLRINCKRKLIKCLTGCYFLRNTALDRFLYRLRKYGSLENYILKSIFGFLSGYFLTYLLFLFLTIQLNVKLNIATLICCVMGCILTLGLAFSEKVRCIVFLTLPQFFSKRGRQALIAYALILTMTGPTKNVLNNMGIMSESLACGQEQLKSAVRQIIDVIKKPFVAIKEAIKAVVKAVKEVVKKIKDILIKIKRIIMAILDVIKAVFQFLGKILSICNKELGTPFERCTRVFESAVTDCQASLGSFFGWACSIGYLLSTVCYIVKPFDLICMLVDFISNSIIGVVVRKVKIFIRHVKTMFYVRIKFSHSFHFQSNSSKSMKDVANSIVGEVKARTSGIVSVIRFFNCAASLFFIFLIYRVINYRHKFLTKERFDNRFLTKNLAKIDLRRAAMDKETILPLNRRERKKYITVNTLRLIDTERKELSEGLSLLMSTAVKISIHMALDYSLYWIMMLIRKYGKFQSKVQTPNIPTIHIAGNGLLADLLKGIVKSFQPLGISLEIDTVPCLPTPLPPDIDRYIQIASILLACLILTIFEPYGLRWRHSILCYYYPKRARERSIWLYNHILRSRSSFLKFARRQLRRKVLGTKKIAKVTCIEYLRSKTNNKCLLIFLGSDKQQSCLFCGEIFRKTDKEAPIECQRPGCTAIYCRQCFEDLENVCTVCLAPIEYGDKSDISEEKDSSDDELTLTTFTSSEDDDSGRSSQDEDSSTDDYSYSYQETEKEASNIDDFKTSSNKDLEKQHIPDYASMQSFNEEMTYSFTPKEYYEEQSESTQYSEDQSLMEKLSSLEDDGVYSSSATSFREAKIDHERFLKCVHRSKCQCLSFDELSNLAAGIPLKERNMMNRLSIEPGDYTNADNLSSESMGPSDEQINEHEISNNLSTEIVAPSDRECEEFLMEFSSDEESTGTQKNVLERSNNKLLLDESHNSIHEIEERRNSENFLTDSELSENEMMILMGKPKQQSNEFTSVEDEYSSSPEKSNEMTNRSSHSVQEPSALFSSPEETAKLSPTTTSKKKDYSFAQSDSSITEFKRPPSLLSRKDSYRHIEFLGIDKPKITLPSKVTSSNRKHHHQPNDRIYHSTVATKTSEQNIPNQLKERKPILKMGSESSVLSEIATAKKNVLVPKLNLSSLVSDTSTDESKPLTTPVELKRKFDGFSNSQKLLHEGNKYIRHTSEPPNTLGNHNFVCEEFTSPTYPFKSEYSSRSDDSLCIYLGAGNRNTSRIDKGFFESSDSSITIPRIERKHSESSDHFFQKKSSSFSMATEGSSEGSKEHRSIKPNTNTSEKNAVRITEASNKKETSQKEDGGGETDGSSDISISVQENILGITKKKKQDKIQQKPEREVNVETSDKKENSEKSNNHTTITHVKKDKKEIDKKTSNEAQKDNIKETDKTNTNKIDKETRRKSDSADEPDTDTKTQQKKITTSSSGTHENLNAGEQADLADKYSPPINSGADSNHSKKSKSSSTQEFVSTKDRPRVQQPENDKECSCCICRNNFPISHQSFPENPYCSLKTRSGMDSYTQTHRDFSDRCCQVERSRTNNDIVNNRCFHNCCSVRCKDEEDSSRFDRKVQLNQHCTCDICTRMIMHQNGSLHDDVEIYRRSPVKTINRNFMRSEYPSTSIQKYKSPRKNVGTVCKPYMRDQASYVKHSPGKNSCRVSFQQEGSNVSLCSDCECCRDIFDLPYQDNDEYTRLVRELEDKLIARNRERVRRTIRQFEECSRRNQNLKKPILYDESTCGEEPILSQLVHLKAGDTNIKSCECANRAFPVHCNLTNCRSKTTVETLARYLDPNQSERLQRYPRVRDVTDTKKWQLDDRTGEWCKVSGDDIGDNYDFYESERISPEALPRRRISNQYDEAFRCDECDELNRRYGHRFHILCCPRHRSDIVPRHRKI